MRSPTRSTRWLAIVAALATANCSNNAPSDRLIGASSLSAGAAHFELVPTISFASTRHDPLATSPFPAAEIYLMDDDLTNVRRITENGHYNAFPTISPNGKKIVFDSDSLPGSAVNNSDLWVMDVDGSEQAYLIHGASATWSRDSKYVAFHASESGTGAPIRNDPGSATIDSDIFTINVDDMLSGTGARVNITNSPEWIDEDPDWSPIVDVIAFTRHSVTSSKTNPTDAEIYLINADGSGTPSRLTNNGQEERAPAWSPDGTKILYMCREVFDEATQAQKFVGPDFEVCVMNADGTAQTALTNNTVGDLTPNWNYDGTKIFFHRPVVVSGLPYLELFMMNANGTGITRITDPPSQSAFPNGGAVRTKVSP